MPRPSNTDERRAQITEALRAVMAHKGYDGASIGDIATHAKLTPGLVHYHFKSKLDILLALTDDLAAHHRARLDQALRAAGESPVARVAAFIDFHLSMRWADPESLACWVTLGGEALRDARVRRRYREAVALWADRLTQVVTDGVRRREMTVAEPRAAACAIVSAIQGYFVLAAVDRTLIPQGSAAESVRRMAVGLLGLRGPLPAASER